MMLVRLAGSDVMVKVSAAVACIAITPCLLFMGWGAKDIDAAAFTRTSGDWRFGEYAHAAMSSPDVFL